MKKINLYLMLMMHSWVSFTYSADQADQDDISKIPNMTDAEFRKLLAKEQQQNPNYDDDLNDDFNLNMLNPNVSDNAIPTTIDEQSIVPVPSSQPVASMSTEKTKPLKRKQSSVDDSDDDSDYDDDESEFSEDTTTAPSYPGHYGLVRKQLKPTSKTKVKKQKRHDEEKPYQCTWPECGKEFSQNSYFDRHMRTHTGEKPYQCTWPECGKEFSQNGYLTRHMRTHTGEKPYQCTWLGCDKSFSEISNLTKHMRTHTGEKPHQCTLPGCGKSFLEISNLTRHMEIHKPQNTRKKFTCLICNKKYSASNVLKKHIRDKHPEQTNTDVTQNENPNTNDIENPDDLEEYDE